MLTAPLTSRQPGSTKPGRPAEAAKPPADGPGRLAWLDVLRGMAALIVALHHASYYYVPQWRAEVSDRADWFEPGKYGVLVFFLVSGYVIPASLERRGNLRAFWIGRFFRIYPLLLVACLAGVLPFLLGVRGLRAGLESHDPVVAILAHLTMLQDVLGVPSTLNVLWTLSYEMIFYLLVVGLFVTGTHRRSALVATLLALAAVSVSALLPMLGLSRALGTGPVVVITVGALVVAITASVSGRPRLAVGGGVLGGLVAALLATMNGRVSAWEGLIYLAVMFAGTALYRAERAAQRARGAQGAQGAQGARVLRTAGVATGLGAAVAVLAAAVAAGVWNAYTYLGADEGPRFALYWSGSVLLAGATFGLAWSLRRRAMPGALSTLGRISFSVYLLHPVLLIYSDQFFGTSGNDEPLRLLIFVVALLVISALTYRWVEAPGQRLGRRVAGSRPVTGG